MFSNPFANTHLAILKEFGEEYIRLAELIILFDKDEWDAINAAENNIKMKMLMQEKTNFPNEKAARVHFARLKVALITKNINNNPGVKKAQASLTRFLKGHSYEVRSFGLSFKDKNAISPAEIYANYTYLVQKVPGLVLDDPNRRRK